MSEGFDTPWLHETNLVISDKDRQGQTWRKMKALLIIMLTLVPIVTQAKTNICLPSQAQAKLISLLEAKHKLPKNSLRTIIRIESCFNPKAINSSSKIHSYGLGQLTIATAKAHCGLSSSNLLDQELNSRCSAKVLAYQFKRYNRNLLMAVLAYNEGTPCVCNGEHFVRNLGRKVMVCKEWKNNNSKWHSTPLKCNKTGKVNITKYYFDFNKFYSLL